MALAWACTLQYSLLAGKAIHVYDDDSDTILCSSKQCNAIFYGVEIMVICITLQNAQRDTNLITIF